MNVDPARLAAIDAAWTELQATDGIEAWSAACNAVERLRGQLQHD